MALYIGNKKYKVMLNGKAYMLRGDHDWDPTKAAEATSEQSTSQEEPPESSEAQSAVAGSE